MSTTSSRSCRRIPSRRLRGADWNLAVHILAKREKGFVPSRADSSLSFPAAVATAALRTVFAANSLKAVPLCCFSALSDYVTCFRKGVPISSSCPMLVIHTEVLHLRLCETA